jgi:hypothetical protein
MKYDKAQYAPEPAKGNNVIFRPSGSEVDERLCKVIIEFRQNRGFADSAKPITNSELMAITNPKDVEARDAGCFIMRN